MSEAPDAGSLVTETLIADLRRAAAALGATDPAAGLRLEAYVRDQEAALGAVFRDRAPDIAEPVSDAQLEAAERAFAEGLAAMLGHARAALGAADR